MNPMIFSWADVLRFGVVFFRVSGIVVFAPFFSMRSFPVQFKVVLAIACTLALYPSASIGTLPREFGIGSMLGFAVTEMLLGMVLGLAASFVFAGLQLAGQIVSFQLGFSIVNMIDPQSEVDMSAFSFLFNYLGLLFFLLLGGHHWFFLAVSESFRYLPVQGIHLSGPVALEVIRLSSKIVAAGVQIASPVLAVTIIVDVVMGIIGRAAPQLNILIVGMPLKILVGFSFLGISFYFLPQLLGEIFSQFHDSLFILVRAMG